MKKPQALEILKILYAFYPNFNHKEIESFNEMWIERLTEGDYEKTMRKVKQYTQDSRFPPSLADVLVIEPKITPPEETEIAKATAAVEKEMADPEMRAKRERSLENARQMFEELKRQ
ncbi:hypothetical protein WN59_06690 [Salinicoccus sediminis]|uniref:Uncharacterized protein n=1 Tax=Salinicoccus sediminis TaxID=1432562 RepID=A0A0M2SP67_9STAP|nr:replicative helicase loader/inhibitor [Salinicoccus sediminis]KKK34712.1 hypothetical protein WN59_06690 [Salinicoccus sediminis]